MCWLYHRSNVKRLDWEEIQSVLPQFRHSLNWEFEINEGNRRVGWWSLTPLFKCAQSMLDSNFHLPSGSNAIVIYSVENNTIAQIFLIIEILGVFVSTSSFWFKRACDFVWSVGWDSWVLLFKGNSCLKIVIALKLVNFHRIISRIIKWLLG